MQDSAVIANDTCFYFMNVNEFCTIASIQTAEEYDAFERFVLHKSMNVTKSICGLSSAAQSLMFYSSCVFSLHNNAYQTFVVHINPIFFKNEFIKTFFSLSRLDSGFYLVDIIRRTLYRMIPQLMRLTIGTDCLKENICARKIWCMTKRNTQRNAKNLPNPLLLLHLLLRCRFK
jgi:hypothetical protein